MTFYRINRIPVKRRARVTRSGHAYVDPKTKADLEAVGEAYKGKLYRCPVKVVVIIYKALPKSTPKRITSEPFTQRPDGDNVLKAILDGLNGKAYLDDAQVIETHVYKRERTKTPGEYCTFAVIPVYTKGNSHGGY